MQKARQKIFITYIFLSHIIIWSKLRFKLKLARVNRSSLGSRPEVALDDYNDAHDYFVVVVRDFALTLKHDAKARLERYPLRHEYETSAENTVLFTVSSSPRTVHLTSLSTSGSSVFGNRSSQSRFIINESRSRLFLWRNCYEYSSRLLYFFNLNNWDASSISDKFFGKFQVNFAAKKISHI